ncbi:MAG: histidinol dehydrogenase [Myxococcales bacterium]|nr:histidinol dehydrogenase [Myxococcales bacterium]MCB9708959.1 histidinol dehydrogenase [Myxococcales bacterium]
MTEMLRKVGAQDIARLSRDPVDPQTFAEASFVVEDVRKRGEVALREHCERFGDLKPDERYSYGPADLALALESITDVERGLLQRTAARIQVFAELQRSAIQEVQMRVPGGTAGQSIAPVERAGCYAPSGRFPLPSSVLMTAITARAAGVKEVWVTSPKANTFTLAAASVAGADGLFALGGAQAIAALAYGAGQVPACDVIVGPGNRWVTAAKKAVQGHVAIDMLAGPSELVVVADHASNPSCVAADLLAQAEHDVDARVVLVSLDESLVDQVVVHITRQLEDLPTADVARASLRHSIAVVVDGVEQAVEVCDGLAPEHLQLSVEDPEPFRQRLAHFGALFSGAAGAEVFGDYGAGPNHVLPTGGTARFTGGLSVLNFLRVRTWLHLDDMHGAATLARDAAELARLEGLEAHARAAMLRYH